MKIGEKKQFLAFFFKKPPDDYFFENILNFCIFFWTIPVFYFPWEIKFNLKFVPAQCVLLLLLLPAIVYLPIVNWATELSALLFLSTSTLHLNLLYPFWLWLPPPKETGQCRDLDKVCDHISVFNWLKLTETRVWVAAETFIQKTSLLLLGDVVSKYQNFTSSSCVSCPSLLFFEKLPHYLCCSTEYKIYMLD